MHFDPQTGVELPQLPSSIECNQAFWMSIFYTHFNRYLNNKEGIYHHFYHIRKISNNRRCMKLELMFSLALKTQVWFGWEEPRWNDAIQFRTCTKVLNMYRTKLSNKNYKSIILIEVNYYKLKMLLLVV